MLMTLIYVDCVHMLSIEQVIVGKSIPARVCRRAPFCTRSRTIRYFEGWVSHFRVLGRLGSGRGWMEGGGEAEG